MRCTQPEHIHAFGWQVFKRGRALRDIISPAQQCSRCVDRNRQQAQKHEEFQPERRQLAHVILSFLYG